MSTDPTEAQFMKMLTFMKQPKQVLEIGMFTGYGAMAIAEALPADGKITSLDIDPYLKTWVEDVSKDFPEGAKHEIVVGPALDSLQTIEGKYDLVFIDANKAEYKAYVETLMERDLLAKDVMIIADNTLYVGYPMLSETYDTQPARRGFGDAVREFNAWVRDHPKLEQVIVPIRDGVSMIRLKCLSTSRPPLVKAAVAWKSPHGKVPFLYLHYSLFAMANQSSGSKGYVGRFDGTQAEQVTMTTHDKEESMAARGTRGRSAAKWSIFSERIEGLAKEMYMLVGSLDPYVRDHSTAEGPAMAAIHKKMDETDWKSLAESKTTMFSYGEEMSTDPIEAQFLKMLTFMKQPKQVLEIGMFAGYGAMAIAEALPADGKITSLDIDPFLKTWVEDVAKN
ncbi:CCOAOMT2 [Symbiodinium pilosum]|uniref:CCOAOMT2 protein n=1 Tax=Symbiodinium pilosum TaxID=2952 RepID=A0A812X9T4_SYMPI|nr:CCOAOMT2 [Symbiodinium pilosum]